MFNRIETNPSDSLEARADQILAANPNATMAMVEMSHGYAKAKFPSRCKLTGDEIVKGEAIRRVKIRTATGHTWEGVMSNRMIGVMEFQGGHGSTANEDWTPDMSVWTRFSAEKAKAIIENAELGTALEIIYPCGGYGENKRRKWTLQPHNGKWARGGWAGGSSPKQLIASMRRVKRALLLKGTPPRS